MNQRDVEQWKALGMVSSIGLTLVIATLIGVGLGWLADRLFHSSPWGIAIGCVVGTVAGFVDMFKVLSQVNRDDK